MFSLSSNEVLVCIDVYWNRVMGLNKNFTFRCYIISYNLILSLPYSTITKSIITIVKAMVFPVVMYRYESWTLKKTECQRIDALELWCCSRLLRVPWTTRRSNQSILKEINPEYSLEGLMLKLKLQ